MKGVYCMKKICSILLCFLILSLTACRGQIPAQELQAGASQENNDATYSSVSGENNTPTRSYVALENTYAPGSHVRFDTSFPVYDFEDADGRIEHRTSGEYGFSGEIEVQYNGPIGESHVQDWFAVPYSEAYSFRLEPRPFRITAFCGESRARISGYLAQDIKWTLNTWTVEQAEAAEAEFLFLQGEDKDFPGTGRFCITVKLSSAAHLEASWVEGQIRILNPGCEILLQISDTQDMKQTEELPLTVTGEFFDLYTDRLAEGACAYEDDAGKHEISLKWQDME